MRVVRQERGARIRSVYAELPRIGDLPVCRRAMFRFRMDMCPRGHQAQEKRDGQDLVKAVRESQRTHMEAGSTRPDDVSTRSRADEARSRGG
jgi:hypothetical protein